MSIVLSSRLCSRPLPYLPTNASPFPSLPSPSPSFFHNSTIKPSSLPRRQPPPPPPPPASFFSSSSRNTPTGRRNYNTIRVSAGGGVGGWFSSLGGNRRTVEFYPDIVKVGDPVLHEPSRKVEAEEVASDAIQKTIEDMVRVMRKAPGVGLAAPQIGVPLRIIVLEDTKEYISYASKKEVEAQDRRPFDLLVIINPKLEKKGNETALFFEGCLSVDGFRAIVERHLEVEVTGLDRKGNAIKVEASGWQARILQHECDHLDGIIYVDRMLPRTFRTVENLTLPLPAGCPELGPV